MRRFLLLLTVGVIVVMLWSDREDPPTPPTPFLCALDVDGETLLVQTLLALDPKGAVRFTVGGPDEDDPVRLSGEPRAAAAVAGAVAVFFDDGATMLNWPTDPDEDLDWRRITYTDPDFRPVAAVGLPDGDVLVAGRLASAEDALAWGRLHDDTLTIETGGPTWNPKAYDPTLLRTGDAATLVWFESWAKGSRVMATRIPPVPDEAPRVLMESAAIGALGGVPDPESPHVLVLEPEGRLTAVSLASGDSRQTVLEGVRKDGHVLLTATGGEGGRLFAFTGVRLLSWNLGDAGLPAASDPIVLVAPPDLRWFLLTCGGVAALIILVLIVISRNRRTSYAEPLDAATELAGYGRRLAAWALDIFLVMPPLILGMSWATGVELARLAAVTSIFGATSDGRMTILVLLIEAVVLLYFVVAEAVWGQTLGKRALEIRAVRLDGARAGLGAVVVRNVLRMVVDVYGGAVLVFLTTQRQRVGDLLARTKVVRTGRGRRTDDADGEGGDDHE